MILPKEASAVLAGDLSHAFVHGDCLEVLRAMPPGSVDFIWGSPPYEDARTYGELGYAKRDEEWVAWMVELFHAAIPVTRGLVAMVIGHGKTRDHRWSATPALLQADLHRSGVRLRCPTLFYRVGIPGSGGKDYFRYDHEWIVAAQNPATAGRTGGLPWSNNTAAGTAPRWAPGGAMSHRLTDGQRKNQWGGNGASDAGDGQRRANGKRQGKKRPSHGSITAKEANEQPDYLPPKLANPGSVAQEVYTAAEVERLLSSYEGGTVAKHTVGGGHMGHPLACDNEAPFPLSLAERFVLSFCPPGGIVLDPFSGSGTTAHAAVANRRRAIGIDLRRDQVELAGRRLLAVQPRLLVESDERRASP